MSMVMECPFYKRDSYLKLYCECASLKFPDSTARLEYVTSYCGNYVNWKKCTLAHCLETYYDREEN